MFLHFSDQCDQWPKHNFFCHSYSCFLSFKDACFGRSFNSRWSMFVDFWFWSFETGYNLLTATHWLNAFIGDNYSSKSIGSKLYQIYASGSFKFTCLLLERKCQEFTGDGRDIRCLLGRRWLLFVVVVVVAAPGAFRIYFVFYGINQVTLYEKQREWEAGWRKLWGGLCLDSPRQFNSSYDPLICIKH